VLVLDEPLSFWGGVNPETGVIIDVHHAQRGACVAGMVLVMPGGRGSSSSSTVVAEVIRNGVGPRAMILATPDPIIAVGVMVARELYGITVPVVAVDPAVYRVCAQSKRIRVETGC